MRIRYDADLLKNIKVRLKEAEDLLAEVEDHWAEQDLVYRYYHHSYKVYYIQGLTNKIVDFMVAVDPKPKEKRRENFDVRFLRILDDGTGHVFHVDHNHEWDKRARPMLEAFWHAKYCLQNMIRSAKEMEEAKGMLASGWAGVLSIFRMR